MAEIAKEMRAELLARIKNVLPSAEYTTEFAGGQPIEFQDSCGCYSELTTESCSFTVALRGELPDSDKEQYALRAEIEKRVERWAKGNLEWRGCECCGSDLWVSVRLFGAAHTQAKWGGSP